MMRFIYLSSKNFREELSASIPAKQERYMVRDFEAAPSPEEKSRDTFL